MAHADKTVTRGELSPKEFRVEVRLRNNRLITYREQLGLKPREMAERIGVSYGTLLRYEGLRKNPVAKWGGWADSAVTIATYHGVSPSFFWPASVLAVEKPMAQIELSSDEARRLVAPGQVMTRLAPSPDDGVAKKELEEAFRLALSSLTDREERVLVYRFGLRGEAEHTYSGTGERFGLSVERIRQIEAKALKTLRRRPHSKRLKPFTDESLSSEHPLSRESCTPNPWGPVSLCNHHRRVARQR
jgi:RNA polymerase sigma factor (sigma-70 family)